MHITEVKHPVLEPEDGLLLGNGDLSVSIYQKSDQIVWRFGKNDVWDRRFDNSDDPEPTHIDEVARGIRDEGWVSKSYRGGGMGSGDASRSQPADPKRMKELCDGAPAYADRPYPCPKPVGELAVELPVDQHGLEISQKVLIEKGEAEIECSWESGAKFRFFCFIPPHTNALVVHWEVENWREGTRTGGTGPIRFILYRWADPDIKAFACDLEARAGYWYYEGSIDSGKVTPLPNPTVHQIAGRTVIEQTFHPDLEYADGFRYALAPFVTDLEIEPQAQYNCGDALVHLRRRKLDLTGWLAVAVPASSDDRGLEGELERVTDLLSDDPAGVMQQWRHDTHAAAEKFWSQSSVEIDDPVLEAAWYETLHARRCVYRRGVIAPGLAFPSTVRDYSLWHGDYHTNYNYQQPFWGNLGSNHVEMADSFFPGMKHMVEIGRKLAHDYWNCRGTFIQLTGYPFPINDDPYGTGGICRMAYMTGWVASYWWWRYLYTQDDEWLRTEAYPIIRDGALFYTDFLNKGDDGLYHAFPSMQGESFYTGRVKDYTDRPQVIRHARYCLQLAANAAEILDADADLRNQWQEIVDHLARPDDVGASELTETEQRRMDRNFPEFVSPDGCRPQTDEHTFLNQMKKNTDWAGGVGGVPRPWTRAVREGPFDPDAALPYIRRLLSRERQPNGVMRGLGADDMGYIGAYVEATGILMPLLEMMLQSWDGAIRVFPAWPKNIDASFRTLRAEGAFLVSAVWRDGAVRSLSIRSERGRPCRVANPWPGEAGVVAQDGRKIETTAEADGTICFDTKPGDEYHLQPS